MTRSRALPWMVVAGCLAIPLGLAGGTELQSRGVARTGELDADDPRGWTWVNPRPQGNDLLSVWVLDDQRAYAAGSAATLVRLESGGRTATFLDTSNRLQAFRDLAFVSEDVGWALYGNGVFKTEDAGLTWTEQRVPAVSPQLMQVKFLDARTGFISAR